MKTVKLTIAALILSILCGCSVPSKGVNVYFFQNAKLAPVERELPTNENPVTIAMDQLMRGPNEQEKAIGFVTVIPSGTRARNVAVEGDTAIIDFNDQLSNFKGGRENAERIVAQIVNTATSVRGVKKVIIELEGSDQFTLGGSEEGYVIDHPLEKDDVKI
jgi:spore germination protein GerM